VAPSRDVHFVGSIGLEDSETVFRSIANAVGSNAKRYPDGETGVRHMWIMWQLPLFSEHPDLEVGELVDVQLGGLKIDQRPYFKIKAGVDRNAIEFRELGYAKAAIDSYAVFKRLRDEGTIPAGTRFQISIPTPAAPIISAVIYEDRAAVEPAYERAMKRDVDAILAALPHAEIAIQWDIATEIVGYDGGPERLYYDDALGGTVERVARVASWMPDAVDLGIHLCYGDPGHKHIVEPTDTATAVLFANAMAERIQRKIEFLHLPVPRERSDDAYFAPLTGLKRDPATELYLGLVHLTGGMEGNRARLATAEKYVQNFGIATECGFGRRDPATIPALLDIHAAAMKS
jgi:hypothetical protein